MHWIVTSVRSGTVSSPLWNLVTVGTQVGLVESPLSSPQEQSLGVGWLSRSNSLVPAAYPSPAPPTCLPALQPSSALPLLVPSSFSNALTELSVFCSW